MKPTYKVLALAAAASLLLAGCGKKENAAPQKAAGDGQEVVVKIGHAAPMTGPQAHIGKDNESGTRLAIEELNAQKLVIGGKPVRFELIAEDDQADPKMGALVAQKFVDAKVNGVIGHMNSGTTMPASRIYSEAGLPQISGSATSPAYTNQGFKTTFRTMANDAQQTKVLAYFAVKKLGAKNIAIVDDRTAYGQGLGDEFSKWVKAQGGNVIAHEFSSDKTVDFKAILTTIKAKKPDLIFFGGMDAQAGPFMRQIKELGIDAKFLTADGGCTTDTPKLAGDGAVGYCSLPGLPLEKMANGPAFKDKFKKRFGYDIQLYAPYLYDATMVMAAAMKKADSIEPAKIVAALPQTDYAGVTAQIQFDAKGDPKGGLISLYQFQGKDKDKTIVETISVADAEPGKAK